VAYMLNVSQPALRGVQACFAMVEAAEAEAAGAQSEAEEAEAETDAEAPDAGAATHRLRDGARSDARSGARYDWVVRARFDLAFSAPLPPLAAFSRARVIVPMSGRPVADVFALVPRHLAPRQEQQLNKTHAFTAKLMTRD